jgi:hypothetical protein
VTSDEMTTVPSLLNYIHSDLFTLGNISTSIILNVDPDDVLKITSKEGEYVPDQKWETVIKYLPLDYYRMIESYPGMYTIEEFDKKYTRNPKMCAYERYQSTNMWRPLMILNRCPTIMDFDFDFIRYYNISTFTRVLSVLIARSQHHERNRL